MARDKAGEPSGKPAPDWDDLARKLLDLWQDHLGAVAADPELTAQMLRLLAANPALGGFQAPPDAASWFQNPWVQSFWGSAAAGPGGMNFGADATNFHAANAKAGAKAAAPTPDTGALSMGELRDRLARLEERLASAEGGAEKSGRRDGKSATKPARGSRARSRKP